MKKKTIHLRSIFALLLAALIFTFTALPSVKAEAASSPSMLIRGEYSSSQKSLTVTVSVKGGGSAIQSGMFALEYDSDLLTSKSGNPVVMGSAISVGTRNDVDNNFVVLEWYFDKALGASDTYTPVAQLNFGVKGALGNDLSEVLRLCTDSQYLNRLGGYGSFGGALLCVGNNAYCAGDKTLGVSWEFESTTKLIRLGGSDRFATSALIAGEGWPTGTKNIVIASASGYVDALAGVPLAKALNAPILLVSGNSLNADVKARIRALSPEKAYILGGTSAVSASIEPSLALFGCDVERISGSDRYETAVLIADRLASLTGKRSSKVFFAYAYNYPDALAVSPVAAISGAPILYAPRSGSIDSKTSAYLTKHDINSATVLGGDSAIGTSVVTSIRSCGVSSVERVYGSDRYATALAICKKYNPVFVSDDISIATGESFPDALAGGALAAKRSIPVILVGSGMKSADIKKYVSGKGFTNVYVFGGTSAVPQSYIEAVAGKF